MKYKVINIESWKANDPKAPDVLNDVILSLKDDVAQRGIRFGALEPIDDFLDEEINPLKCKICEKICKSPAGLKVHMRSHK